MIAVAALSSLLQVSLDVNLDPVLGALGSGVTAFVTTLVVGAIAVAVFPEYTEARMAEVLEEPVDVFVYGLFSLIFLLLVTIVLVLTFIGIVVAIPLLVVSYVLWALGSAIAFLAIADRIVGHEDGWGKPLLVGAGMNGLLTVTGIGGLISIVVGAAGFGAVLRQHL